MPDSGGVSSTPRLFCSITGASEYWIARSSRAMTAGVWRVRISRTPPHSRGTMGPSFARQCPSIIEGAGNAGRSMHPKPRVQMVSEAHEHSHHGHTGFTRHSPRNGFTVSFVLFPVTSLFDTVACASYRRLDASIGASEPHDFAVRCSTFRQAHRPRPPHPAPRS